MARDAQAQDSPHELTATYPTSPPLARDHHIFERDVEPTTTSRSRNDYTFPEGGTKAWLVIFGSFCIIAGTFGLISSVGLFQAYWQTDQLSSYTTRDIGWISAVNVFLNLFLGVQIGPLFDRYGPRWLILSGSVIYVLTLVLLAECKKYYQFMLVYGVLGGVSSAFLTTTALAVVAHWFEKKRGIASGIAFVGSSVGGIMFPLILKSVFEHLSWAWSMRIVALIVAGMMIAGNLCIKGRLPPRKNGGAVDLRCFRDARFSWATVGVSCFEFVLFGALGLLPTYAILQGFSSQTAFNIIAILNAGSALGRSLSGYISDHLGRFNTMLLTLIWSLVVTLALWLPIGKQVVLFYIFAPLFGFGSGSIISMAPVCIGQLCKADEYGQFYGTSYSVVAFAVLICIPVGGELLPAVGGTAFVGLFGGILVLSLVSFLMARWACLEYRWQWIIKI
ncbi:MFS monocarboxylate transporter [Mollisia scopiformis]|uniref:MFS monocarboxylate transporter n=1 Tax=Mollisia scopiformis TaxID=149040 RepID=A0A194XW09_MOLSC|nr:MFS monocarboxylate transporter [Mollisia scopiformis]KUJ23902.1 MFS monocarboxylate transporter [Mollisia scopiformis]